MFLTVGDAPIAVARYRIITTAEGTVLTEVDRLGILIPYRGQKYANKIITPAYKNKKTEFTSIRAFKICFIKHHTKDEV